MSDELKDWWDKWWEEDYSWEGLAKKPWAGWCVLPRGKIIEDPSSWPEDDARHESRPRGARPATLQDYWRDQKNGLFASPVSGKRFTIIHLPLQWEDGTPTPDVEQTTILQSKLAAAVGVKLAWVRSVGPDSRAQCDGAVLRFFNVAKIFQHTNQDGRCVVALAATRTFFFGDSSFDSATFSGDALFNCAAFSGTSSFNGSVFSGKTVFAHAQFWDSVRFDNATFQGLTFFEGAVFLGLASFYKSTVSGGALFNCASFLSEANFSWSAFKDYASFDAAAFFGYAGFSHSTFLNSALFTNATFTHDAWLDNAVFAGTASFKGVGAQLLREHTSSKECPTLGKASLPLAFRSFKMVFAEGAVFLSDAIFDNRDIHEPSSFNNCTFLKRASFHGSKLHQGVTFHDTVFEGSLDPARVDAMRSNFLGIPIHALERLFEAQSGFRKIKFGAEDEEALSIEQAAQAKSEWEAKFKIWKGGFLRKRTADAKAFRDLPQKSVEMEEDSKDKYYAGLEDAFRTLKLAMENSRNRSDEARFFKLELLARRRRSGPAVSVWEKVFSHVYEWTSDFGNDAIKPLVLCLLIIPMFGLVYSGLASVPVRWTHLSEYVEATSFSASRVLPIGPWTGAPEPCSTMGRLLDVKPKSENLKDNPACGSDLSVGYGPVTKLGISALATIQSLIAIILFFLSALAARRRFQIN